MLKIRNKVLDSNRGNNTSSGNTRQGIKIVNWLILTAIVLIPLMLLVTGCGKKGSLNPLEPPEVFITSYEGVEDSTAVADPYYFQKRIYWRGESRGGTVEGYAYRVLNLDREPINLPKRYIDEEGWIYHYKPGADQSLPLSDPDVRTIWTTKVYDVINFPATIEGDSTNVTSIFEVKCIDNYEQESQIASRYFNVTSHVPDLDIIFAERFYPLAAAEDPENPMFKTIGLGIDVQFEFFENTPYTTEIANYFMFRLQKKNRMTGELLSQKPEDGGWYDTSSQRNVSRIWLAMEGDDPADFPGRDDVWFVLNPDEFSPPDDPNNPVTETFLEVRSVNMANVQSPSRTAKFRVYENFRPRALVYTRRTNLLGANHFTTFQDASLQRPLPEIETPEGTHYGTPFFINGEGELAALGSDDIRIFLRWGWGGQYDNNDPDQGFINEVHDILTGVDYLATVKAFDLRLAGQPYYYPPLWDDPEFETKYLYVDDDGTEWLRVPRYHEIDTRAVLTDVEPGENTFEVRILDSQNRTSEPEEFTFVIKERVPLEEKQGILIVDNEDFAAIDNYINDFYDYIVSDYSGPVKTLNRRWIKDNLWDNRLHHGRNVISPTDLESYRLVIWHCDNPTDVGANSTNFHEDFDTINLYMRGNGNILLSAGANLKNIHQEAFNQAFYNFLLERYFGIEADVMDAIRRVSENYQTNPYFIGAELHPNSPLNLPDIDLYPEVYILVEAFGALGPVAYFDMDLITDPFIQPLYSMRTTEAGEDFAGLPVALKRQTDNNTTYMFGFPLSFMVDEQVKAMMNVIIDDLGL